MAVDRDTAVPPPCPAPTRSCQHSHRPPQTGAMERPRKDGCWMQLPTFAWKMNYIASLVGGLWVGEGLRLWEILGHVCNLNNECMSRSLAAPRGLGNCSRFLLQSVPPLRTHGDCLVQLCLSNPKLICKNSGSGIHPCTQYSCRKGDRQMKT